MKKILTAAILLGAISFFACCNPEVKPEPEPDPEPEPVVELKFVTPSDTALVFGTQATSYVVNFNCTDMWTASVSEQGPANWVSIFPASGVPGAGKFTVTVNSNGTMNENDATIVISFKDKTASIKLHQQALTRMPYTYKGAELIQPLADAYDVFIKEDKMPGSIKIGEEELSRGYYYEAMCLLLPDIAAGGDAWKTKTYTLLKCSGTDASTKYETFAPDEIDLEKVLWINDKQYNYAKQHSLIFANYCTVDDTHFSQYRSIVVNARFIYAFVKNGTLPEKVSSWQSDFLRNMEYNSEVIPDKFCDINDPVVVAARDAAIAGKTTAYDKVKAIFEYARDKWEWEDYYNTRKGALTTINAKGGNCCDLTHAIIAMARSAGIPARYVHGPETYYPSGSIWGHVWPELYADGKWYVCDASNNASTLDHPVWILEKSTINGKYRDLPF